MAAFRFTGEARRIAALARNSRAEEWGLASPLGGYQARRSLDRHLSQLAARIGGRPRPHLDDLLALALAGWYASGPRETLVQAVLRAGGFNPRAPHLRSGGRR